MHMTALFDKQPTITNSIEVQLTLNRRKGPGGKGMAKKAGADRSGCRPGPGSNAKAPPTHPDQALKCVTVNQLLLGTARMGLELETPTLCHQYSHDLRSKLLGKIQTISSIAPRRWNKS